MGRRGAGRAWRLLAGAWVCLLAPVAAIAAAGWPADEEFHLLPADAARLVLAHRDIDPTTVRVSVDGRPWRQGVDYRLRSRSGVIVPLHGWRPPGGDDIARVVVVVRYHFRGVPVPARRDLRPVVERPRAGAGPTAAGGGPAGAAAGPAWQGENLQVSGSKTVQVASGSRRELTVDQNLRLNVAGRLTEDITVRAHLSDDNLPVVPEGNTEELRDIDKVLVELRGPVWAATLGDFVAERRGSEFGRYRRKLQGVAAEATPGRARAEVLAGSPRGLYRTLQIRGEESNQGPYYLGGGAGTDNLFVVAGSERVTLDGEPLTRGADRDYVIDYVRGTVTFTYRRLITAESTIVVEFEEGEGPYGRTVAGGGAGAGFTLPVGGVPGMLDARVVREKDDPTRLRTGELGEADEAILAAAGDDPTRAVAPGAIPTAPGEGLYDQQIVGGKTIYVHAPDGGDWDLVTYYVGQGGGDYELQQITDAGDRIFAHVGDGLGSYRIGRPLDMPTSRSVATMRAGLGDSTGAHLRAEWDVSQDDRNLLSDLDDGDNTGQAGHLRGQVPDLPLSLGGRGLGAVRLDAFYTARQASFRGFTPHRTVFDYDDWGLSDRARRTGFLDEGDREFGAEAGWRAGGDAGGLDLHGRTGTLRHGVGTDARRWSAGADWRLAGGRGRHEVRAARAEDAVDPLDVTRRADDHEVSWTLGPLVPSGRWLRERWEDARTAGPAASGYRREEWTAGLAARPGAAVDWRASFTRGRADSLRVSGWGLERDARTTRAGVTTREFAGVRLLGEGTLRHVRRPAGADETTRLGRVNLSGRWERSRSDWSLGYRVDNSRAEVLDRQVVFVGEGQGDYNQDGEYLGPEQGDHDVVYAGTGETVATTAVQADLHWQQGFDFLGRDRWYGAWSLLSTGTVGGRSTTDDVGGLLRLDPAVLYDPEHTVLAETVFGEELTLLRHLRAVDLRGRFDYRRSRDRRYATDPEDRIGRDWRATGNVNVSRRSTVRLHWGREDARRDTAAQQGSRRGYRSLTRRWELGWTVRPTPDLRLGLQGEWLRREDARSGVAQRELAARPTLRQRFMRDWTLQADLRWAEVRSEEPAGALRPWFYPLPGRNVESTLRLAWDPTEFLNVAVSWFTRKEGERRWQHDVRLESTARF